MRAFKVRWALMSCATALIFLSPGTVAAATVVAPQVKFMQFNTCGANTDNTGCTTLGFYNHNLAAQLLSVRPIVASINEICENQYNQLFPDLADGPEPALTFLGHQFVRRQDMDSCLNSGSSKAVGIAILTQKAASNPQWEVLDPGNRRILCVTTTVGTQSVALAACVTHLGTDGYAQLQVDEAKDFALTYGSGKAVFFGGDFNMI